MKIDFFVKYDDDDARNYLEEVDRRLNDFRPLFLKIQKELEMSWSSNFTTLGLTSGSPWKPLDSQYGSWKAVNFPGAPPMVKTGQLFSSLSDLRGKPNEIERMRARFGTNIEYAKFHQYGTTRMPKRQIVFVEQGAESRWADQAADYVLDGVEGINND